MSKKIRVLAVGLIEKDNCLFVSEGFDKKTKQFFYRALGGGVDFGETSLAALQREFQEEIQASLTNITYLGCLENIFTYEGELGHELLQVYRCEFSDPHFYELEELTFQEGKRKKKALWVEIERFRTGGLRLVPEQFLGYLR